MEGNNSNNRIFSLLLNGCELAKKLEDDLYNNLFVVPSTSSSPLIISKRCEEIIRTFSIAKEQLDSMHPPPLNHHLLHNQHPQEMVVVDVGLEGFQGKGKGKEVAEGEGDEREGKPQYRMLEVVGVSSSSGQQKNPRRSSRNDEQGNRRMKMPAPQIGNTEMPPDDGFTWRKYGQKEILNARFPRSYYRCTHQKLYNCPAKKQVQRLDDDPNFFEILYRGDHTCHMSNTAPTVPPPPPPPSSQTVQFIPHQQITTVPSPLDWLSVDLTIPSSEGAYTIFHHHHHQLLHSVSSSDSILTNLADVGPSTTVRSHHHQGGDRTVDLLNNNQPLVDWTDMFNSGSSGSNSMEVIFSSSTNNDDNKWENNKDIKD